MCVNAETINLYNDNGRGGIHQSTGDLVIDEGQYYVDIIDTFHQEQHLRVYRICDDAHLMYKQPRWAEEYQYAIEWNNDTFYFNMMNPWLPSLTEKIYIKPVRKLTAYRNDNGGRESVDVVLVENNEKYCLYYGARNFVAIIQPNTDIPDYAPAWVRNYRYRSDISGIRVYFNLY